MRARFIGWIAVVAAVLNLSPGIYAQTAPGPGAAKATADLSGVWGRRIVRAASGVFADEAGGVPFLGFTKAEPPLQPAALETYKANRKGVADARLKGRDELDPVASCFPPGPTRIFTDARPFEIRQTPKVVYILSEWDHWVRRIYADGREHPYGYPSTWMGLSLGKYEGNTLVADTVDISDQTWIDSLGHPHSEELHVVERFRRVNRNTLEIEFTFNDPKTYTKPWTAKKVYQLQPPDYEMKPDVLCEQYRKLGLKKDGFEFLNP